jgi:hypothetical protein
MRRFTLYIVLIILCFPSFGYEVSFGLESDHNSVIIEPTPEVSDDNVHHSKDMNAVEASTSHDCCDNDNTSQLMQCCEEGCTNCSSDCNNSGSALLTTYNHSFLSSSATLLSSIHQQLVAPYQNHLRPPIS